MADCEIFARMVVVTADAMALERGVSAVWGANRAPASELGRVELILATARTQLQRDAGVTKTCTHGCKTHTHGSGKESSSGAQLGQD